METLLKLLQALFSSPDLLLILTIGLWLYYNYNIFLAADGEDVEKNQRRANSRKIRLSWIEERAFEQRYLEILGHYLDKFSTRLTKDEDSFSTYQSRDSWPVRVFGLDPFTENSYVLCLRLAFFYPIVGFFTTWFLGGAGDFSGLKFFPFAEYEWLRLPVFIGTLLLGWLLFRALRVKNEIAWV
uniref:Uncharacterized protein n=1 Tax=Candidatus Kentrum sp. LFY TaxID=2126342 RepID=A0A450WIP0_9GAMM|nr:MAG: hypothetical protein BECKLFY1418C_GA0070996_10277 [Candidatus Kentron sp. LFY]